jgi:RNA polymerase sigma factor (sigma-70 family)
MGTSQINEVVQQLRRNMWLRFDGLTDGQLLQQFIEHRDETAFAALVRRHGAMVWGVCRRLLDPHDAEDAFQASFLVLVQKAGSIAPRERVASWLHGVAQLTALEARRTATRRRARERLVTEMPDPAVVEQGLWRELRPLLDQELSRLPETYREVIVRCDLEGATRKQAARQLGLPEGTIASRLARARRMLAKRLARRDLTLSSEALAGVLAQQVASVQVPASVVSATLKASHLPAAGLAAPATVSVAAAALMEGVMKAMLIRKLKIFGPVVLILACVGSAAMTLLPAATGQPTTVSGKKAQPSEPAKNNPAVDANKEDMGKLQGFWEVAAFINNGTARDEEEGQFVRFRDNKVQGLLPGGTFRLDTSTKPAQITLIYKRPVKIDVSIKETVLEKEFNAIYELRGDDLKIAYSTLWPPVLPKELKSTESNCVTLILFKRVKREPDAGK